MMLLPPAKDRVSLFWVKLFVALLAATVLPIGIHTVMLDVMGIPYPSAFPKNGWASFPDHVLIVLGVLYLDAVLWRDPRPLSATRRIFFLFLTLAAINQALFRLPVMLNAVSTRWTIYPFLDNLPEVLRYAVITTLVVAVGRMASTVMRKIAAATLIALATYKVVAPWLSTVFASMVAVDQQREGDQLYNVPYDWHVNLPSYVIYLEPALAALSVALLLGQRRLSSIAITAIIFSIQGGPFFGTFLNSLYASSGPGLALLSKGQFTLEALALALLTSATSVMLIRKQLVSSQG
ncbi:MAG: hypothetical protein ACRYG8_15720 [Janthinobacterium lividum]